MRKLSQVGRQIRRPLKTIKEVTVEKIVYVDRPVPAEPHPAEAVLERLEAANAELAAKLAERETKAELFDEPAPDRPAIIREDVPFTSQQAELIKELSAMNNKIQMGFEVDQKRYEAVHAGVQWLRKHIEIV